MTVGRVVGLIALVLVLVAVISQPLGSAAMARSGGQALGSAGTSLSEFVSSLTGRASTGTTNDGSDGEGSYTVRPGDTLSSIATTHGTRTDTLAELNDVADPDLIRPGEQLSLR